MGCLERKGRDVPYRDVPLSGSLSGSALLSALSSSRQQARGLIRDQDAKLDLQWSNLSLVTIQSLAEVDLLIVDNQQSRGQGSHSEAKWSGFLGLFGA